MEDGLVGTTLDGRYRILRLLGTGGMGAVYVAEHVGLHQRVAIKLMLGAADDDARVRFQREARAAARVVNEHVVRVFDVSSDGGRSYIAMEYVEGTDLEQQLASGPMDVDRAVAIVRQVLIGVSAIHAAGLVHRDIKPSNVLLTSRDDGSDLVKIMDFGVAKTVEIGDDTLTSAGHAVGTIAYMAPEQLVGGNVDHRADLYAVGLVLYRMLAGELPSTAFTRVAEAKRGERPMTPALQGMPPTIADALACVLDPDPARRFGHASDFIAALDGAPITARDNAPTAVGRPSASGGRAKIATAERAPVVDRSATQVTPPPRRARTAVVAAVALVGVVVAIIVVATRKKSPPAVAPPAITSTADARIDHLARARDAELAGKLALAIVEYEEALAQNGPPELLYRLGELSERLGRRAEAVVYYERYLVARPDAPDRDAVRARIGAVGPPVDAGVAVLVAKDAGVATPPRDARRPSTVPAPPPTPTTASAPSYPPFRGSGTRCECFASQVQLCAAVLQVPECPCATGNQTLCKYPWHTVDGSSTCVDIKRDECLDKKFPDDCYAWIESSSARDGDSCQGYVMETTPIDGTYDCHRCETIWFAAEGRRENLNGTPCRGFDRKTGAAVDGTLRYCR